MAVGRDSLNSFWNFPGKNRSKRSFGTAGPSSVLGNISRRPVSIEGGGMG